MGGRIRNVFSVRKREIKSVLKQQTRKPCCVGRNFKEEGQERGQNSEQDVRSTTQEVENRDHFSISNFKLKTEIKLRITTSLLKKVGNLK